jgi:hypothetical protein
MCLLPNNMSIIKTWNTVSFNLELIVDFDYHMHNKENDRKLHEVTDKVRATVADLYPAIKFSDWNTVSGHYGGKNKGPALVGTTDINTFKEVFGENVKKGISIDFVPFTIVPIPLGVYAKWYQTGDLIIPDSLNDTVKGVYLQRLAKGSFAELKLKVPKNAMKY